MPAIREAVDADLLAVASLYEQLAPDSKSGLDQVTPKQQDAWQAILAAKDLTILVAEVDGVVVGSTALLLMPSLTDDCSPTGFIENMVVDNRSRRSGIGRLLIEEATQRASRAGCRRLQLLSHKDHAADAHEFYRCLGFVPEAEGFRRYL